MTLFITSHFDILLTRIDEARSDGGADEALMAMQWRHLKTEDNDGSVQNVEL